jgi:ATP-dependent exoDNAse (exonuclease V) beta subunit
MPHISFSELKNWDTCPFYHKLVNIDKIRSFQGNAYTAFGNAMHTVCENKLLDESLDEQDLFDVSFLEELKKLPEKVIEDLDGVMVDKMRIAGKTLSPLVIPALDEYFPDGYEVLATEENLMVPIQDFTIADYDFKGFIDLVIKTPDNKVHILDWKTCSWGWDNRKKAEPMTTYQLTFYKKYYAQKHNMDLKDIETYFALLKRTAKSNHVEIFRVTSGPKKTENATKLLSNALTNINKKNYIKNRIACHGRYGTCEFYNTKHCEK